MKYLIIMTVLFCAFTTTVQATQCDWKRINGHWVYVCPTPKPTGSGSPAPTATATATVLPSTTPYATPSVSPQPTQEPTQSPQATPTTTASPSSSPLPTDQSNRVSNPSDSGDGRSDGRTDSLGCQRPEDGCGGQVLALPATGGGLLLTMGVLVILVSIGAALVWMTERQK